MQSARDNNDSEKKSRPYERPAVVECEAPRCPDCECAEFTKYRTEPTEQWEPATVYVTCDRCNKKIKIRWF